MKKFINLIIGFLVLSLFSACSSSKNSAVSLPSWYLNTPKNNSEYFYSVGQSYDLEKAKKEALNNISEYLVISLKTSYSSRTKTLSSNGFKNYEKEDIKEILSETKKIDFINYETIKAQNIANKFYVLVRLEKSKLFNSQVKILEEKDSTINNVFEEFDKLSLLEKISLLKDNEKLLQSLKDQALILYAIDDSFDFNSYHKKADSYLDKTDSLKQKIQINIKSQDEVYKNYLAQFFNENSYKVSKNGFNVEAKIINKTVYSKAMAWDIAKVSSSIQIISNGKVISTNSFNLIGRSSSNKQNAYIGSSKSFNLKLKELGIQKVLFGKK